MKISRLKMSNGNQDELIAYLAASVRFDYKNFSPDTSILMREEFYFRTSSYQLNVIILKRVDAYLYIDLVGGGGGEGFLGLDWGSEKAFIKQARRLIAEFCEQHGVYLESVA